MRKETHNSIKTKWICFERLTFAFLQRTSRRNKKVGRCYFIWQEAIIIFRPSKSSFCITVLLYHAFLFPTSKKRSCGKTLQKKRGRNENIQAAQADYFCLTKPLKSDKIGRSSSKEGVEIRQFPCPLLFLLFVGFMRSFLRQRRQIFLEGCMEKQNQSNFLGTERISKLMLKFCIPCVCRRQRTNGVPQCRKGQRYNKAALGTLSQANGFGAEEMQATKRRLFRSGKSDNGAEAHKALRHIGVFQRLREGIWKKKPIDEVNAIIQTFYDLKHGFLSENVI